MPTPPLVITDGGRAFHGFGEGNRGRGRGDCVARAIAIATGQPYDQVWHGLHARMDALPPRRIRRPQGTIQLKVWGDPDRGVPRTAYQPYLQSLGWAWHPLMHIGQGCTVHLDTDELPASGRFILRVSKHIVAYVDGEVHDTHDPSRKATRCVYGMFYDPTQWQPS